MFQTPWGRVIRILLLLNTETAAESIAHLYLGEAKNLRVRGADAGVSTET